MTNRVRKSQARWLCAFFVMLLSVVRLSSAAPATQITAVAVNTTNGKTQIVITLNQKPRYSVFALDRPSRTVIDFENVSLRTRLPANGNPEPIVKLRSGKRPSQGLRMVADLSTPARLNHTLKNIDDHWELVVELSASKQTVTSTAPTTSPIIVEEEPTIEIPAMQQQPEKVPTKISTIKKTEINSSTKLNAETEDEVEAVFQKAAGISSSPEAVTPREERAAQTLSIENSNLTKNTSEKTSSRDKFKHSETSFRPPSKKSTTEPEKPLNTSAMLVSPEPKIPEKKFADVAPTEIKTPTHSRVKPLANNLANNNDEDVLHDEIFPSVEKGLPSRYLAKRDVIIVIDAGHGGKDPGAVNPNGTREKDVTLAIAQRLQRLLHQEPGIKAILTRPNDTFIGLRARLNVARHHKADVFVSIHADAFKTPEAHGASVFALSPSGASSEAARWLAEKENTSELGEVNLEDKGAALRSVLLDLSQTATISLSVQLGSHLLSQLGKVTNVRHGKVEQARFMVLKSPDIPSILVETGFISNAEEARKLGDPMYQMRIATALKTALRRHFVQYPPPGTMLAVQHNKSMKHVVGKDETLAQVAKRYEITPDSLRKHNQLTSYRVSTGQILYIPNG